MRKELELIEKIEAWLQGRLSPAEMQEMDEGFVNDPQLQAEVELQRQLMTGIQRASLKEQAIKAKKRYVFRRRFTHWGLGAGIALLLAVALIYYKHQTQIYPPRPLGAAMSSQPDTAQHAGIEPANLRDIRIQSPLITTSRDTTPPVIGQVPANSHQYNNQLDTGIPKFDNNANLVTHLPLEHELVPVDPQFLDFYPPHYLDSLRKWGYDINDRRFTDSLYFSLAANYHPRTCGIDPAKIKLLWSSEFMHTFIPTREFEERLHWLHECSNGDSLLDVYTAHLDWKLSAVDSLAATLSTGEQKMQFRQFAARYDGKSYNTSRSLKGHTLLQFNAEEQKRGEHFLSSQELRSRLILMLFPCWLN